MAVLALHPDARADLDAMVPSDASLIAVILQEIENDPDLAEHLLDHGFGQDRSGPYAVSRWNRFWNDGADVWRLRLWRAEWLGLNCRIVYAYLHAEQRFYVLAIVPRDKINYDDPNHHLALRIRAAYDGL